MGDLGMKPSSLSVSRVTQTAATFKLMMIFLTILFFEIAPGHRSTNSAYNHHY